MYRLYGLVLALGFLLALPFYVLRGKLGMRYLETLPERFGRLAGDLGSDPRPSIWIHAVSVGEVLAARVLLAPLKRRFPQHRVLVSMTTLTGRGVAERTLGEADGLFFVPFDFRGSVRRVLAVTRPTLLLLVETELWPNLIHEARRQGAEVALVNGRISPRSFSRYRRIRRFLRPVLSQVGLFLMQEPAHVERIAEMGAPRERSHALGSLKYDALEEPNPPEELKRLLSDVAASGAPILVAGSTVAGEEPLVLEAFERARRSIAGLRLVLAPRHPERFDLMPELLQLRNLSWARRSSLSGPWRDGDVLLLDTLGELAQVYPFATVVFVGGSLVPRGGHNVLEAAVAGKAIVVGPHMENFQQIADDFKKADGLLQVSEPDQLAPGLIDLLESESRRVWLGENARALIEANRGALERTMAALDQLVTR